METSDHIIEEIYKIKKLISEIDSHSDDSKFFYKLSRRIKWLAYDIDRVHSGYYVAFVEEGSDDDFERTYFPLGLMTADNAHRVLDEELINDNVHPWNDCGIKEVTEEEFNKYCELISIQKFYDNLHDYKFYIKDILPSDLMDDLEKKIDSIRSDLGLAYRWIRVASRY